MDQEDVKFVDHKRVSLRPVSEVEIHQLGAQPVKFVETLEDLRKSPPNVVISECVKDIGFIQNNFRKQRIFKKNNYVSSLSIYHQLHYNPITNERILRPANVKFKNVYKPYRGENLQGKTILFWRTGGIGDLLFIKPLLVYIKKTFSPCKIMFSCGPQYQPMVETWEDCVDDLIDLPFTLSNLWKSNYHALFEGVIERCREGENTNCYELFAKWLDLPVSKEDLVPHQTAKEEKIKYCRDVLKEWGLDEKSFILIQVRASSPIRTPSPLFWKSIIDKLTSKGYRIVITDSPRQNIMMQNFISTLNNKDQVYNFCKYSETIDSTIAMCSLSKSVIATDTALIHIAVSLEIKAFGIYCPFPGHIRLSTYPKHLCSWIDSKIDCSPCFKHGHEPCQNSDLYGHSRCYDKLDIDEIIEKFEELMDRKNV